MINKDYFSTHNDRLLTRFFSSSFSASSAASASSRKAPWSNIFVSTPAKNHSPASSAKKSSPSPQRCAATSEYTRASDRSSATCARRTLATCRIWSVISARTPGRSRTGAAHAAGSLAIWARIRNTSSFILASNLFRLDPNFSVNSSPERFAVLSQVFFCIFFGGLQCRYRPLLFATNLATHLPPFISLPLVTNPWLIFLRLLWFDVKIFFNCMRYVLKVHHCLWASSYFCLTVGGGETAVRWRFIFWYNNEVYFRFVNWKSWYRNLRSQIHFQCDWLDLSTQCLMSCEVSLKDG